jgi:transposase
LKRLPNVVNRRHLVPRAYFVLKSRYHERYVGTLLKQLGFSHMSARPRHPRQDAEIIEAFKKTSRAR